MDDRPHLVEFSLRTASWRSCTSVNGNTDALNSLRLFLSNIPLLQNQEKCYLPSVCILSYRKHCPVAGAMQSHQTLTCISARMKSIHNVTDWILFADWMKGQQLWFALWKAHSRKPPVGSTKIESETNQKDGVLLPQYFLSKPPRSLLFKQKD